MRLDLHSGALFIALSLFGVPAAFAQQPGTAFSGYRENADKPIDIEADLLEVDDKKQIATFRGNVSATQGDFNLRSKELEVIYARGASADAKPAAAAEAAKTAGAQSDPFGGGDIRFIRAKGRVFVTSKDNQTATSEEAFFDVKAQKVTLERDVTLSQGGNVIKGDKLLIDIATGRSTFEQAEGGKQRLRAVFTRPESNNKSGDTQQGEQRPGAASPAQPAPRGWQTQDQ